MKKHVLSRSWAITQLGFQARKLKKSEEDRVKASARDYLIQSMGRLKGLPQKVGQILSMSSQQGLDNEFVTLTNRGEAVGLDIILDVLKSTWGKDPLEVLHSIEENAHAASLGQVHRAFLQDGREVAIKVRYPDIETAIQADLKLVGWLSTPFGGLKQGFDTQSYQDVITQTIQHELDYRHEAARQRSFHHIQRNSSSSGWVVPALIEDLCGDQVLVSEWHSGDDFTTVCSTWTDSEKHAIQKVLAEVFFHTVFDQGLFHADPHPGNYAFRRKPSGVEVILYDFGCTADLPLPQRHALLKLFQGALEQGNHDPYPWYVSLQFNPDYLEPLAHRLPALTELMLEPFLSLGKYDFSLWNRSERASAILAEDRWNLRIAAPAKMLLLTRAFIGLFYYLQHLNSPIWLRPFVLQRLERHAEALQRLQAPTVSRGTTYESMASYLKILVREKGRMKVQLTMKRASVNNLPDLIPPETVEKIEERGISLEQIVDEVRRNLYRPGELFRLDIAELDKEIRVWME